MFGLLYVHIDIRIVYILKRQQLLKYCVRWYTYNELRTTFGNHEELYLTSISSQPFCRNIVQTSTFYILQ